MLPGTRPKRMEARNSIQTRDGLSREADDKPLRELKGHRFEVRLQHSSTLWDQCECHVFVQVLGVFVDGSFIYTCSKDRTLRQFDVTTLECKRVFSGCPRFWDQYPGKLPHQALAGTLTG